MYKEYPKRSAPGVLQTLAEKIRTADAFVLVTGEYNWGVQPGLKNLTDPFLEAWFGRPEAVFSYSANRPVMAARGWSRPSRAVLMTLPGGRTRRASSGQKLRCRID